MGVLDKLLKKKAKPVMGELGSTNASDWSAQNAYSTTSTLTLEKLAEMKRDPTVKMGLFVVNVLLRSRFRSYMHKNPEIQTFVRQNLSRVKFRKQFKKMMTYRWVGASITEMVWEYFEGKVQLAKLITYWPDTWFSKGIPKDDKTPVIQKVDMMDKPIPREKVIILQNHDEFGENGSILDGSVYDFWESKYNNLRKWDDALDRFGSPAIRGKVNNEGFATLKEPNRGTTNTTERTSATDVVAGLLAAYRKNKVLVTDSSVDVDFVTTPAIGENYQIKIQYDDKMIMRAMMIPALLIDSDMKNGSYALSESQFNYFWLLMEGELNALNDELIDQLVRPLLEYNFPLENNDYGHFNLDDLQEKDYAVWMNIFMQLTNAGYLNPLNQWHVKKVLEYLNLLDNEIDPDDATVAQENNEKMMNNTLLPRNELDQLNKTNPATLDFEKK
jgi:hypothetical protein